jgi:hypothetical protein
VLASILWYAPRRQQRGCRIAGPAVSLKQSELRVCRCVLARPLVTGNNTVAGEVRCLAGQLSGAIPWGPARGPGRPPKPAYPRPPVNLRQLAVAHAGTIQQVTWRQGTKATPPPR